MYYTACQNILHLMSSAQGNLLVSCGRTGGWEPGKMGRGGKGGKPVESSKRVESGRNNGKLLLDAHYSLQLKKG